jgi:rhamnogalacturonyl hydrolase YesR
LRTRSTIALFASLLLLACGNVNAQTAPAANAGSPPQGGRGRGRGGAPPAALGTLPADQKDAYWGTWPSADPRVVGPRLILNYVSRPAPRPWGAPGGSRAAAWYGEACVGFGSLRYAQEIGDKALADKVVARYAPLLTPEGRAIAPPPDHVDRSVFGIVPFELFHYTHNPAFLELGKSSADAQWGVPPTPWNSAAEEKTTGTAAATQGLTYQTRFWIDDMYMITSLQMQAYRMTKDKVYLDRAAKEMSAYLDRLQKPNGLFFHAESSPFYWGRGNGWVAAGLTELLSELPADHPSRPHILECYHKMMAALLQFQDPDGMWHQLLDKPESFKETSCTGMFTFAFAMGVRDGLLDEAQYKPAAKKGWVALCSYLDDNANIRDVCEGTNKSDNEPYYLARRRLTGDLHGQAGAIWAAYAMSRGAPSR